MMNDLNDMIPLLEVPSGIDVARLLTAPDARSASAANLYLQFDCHWQTVFLQLFLLELTIRALPSAIG
jgi:hypothetical protein